MMLKRLFVCLFVGEIPMWHHVSCFFEKRADVVSSSQLKGFSVLRYKNGLLDSSSPA